MEAELCSGSSSVVDKKRKRKRGKSNRNGSDLRMEKENYFPEKNSSVNEIITLPSPADSSSALENSKAQPCNELNPLPAKRKQKKRKKKRKIQETSTTQGDTGAEIPYSGLGLSIDKENYFPEKNSSVNVIISLPSPADSSSSLENSKAQPCNELNPLPAKKKQKKRKKKRKIQETSTAQGDTGVEVPYSGSDLRMDKENNFPEKNSSVNVIISLPTPADSSSALENSKAQPCNELNPLPAKRKQKKGEKKRKIQETSATQGDTGAEVPYSVLQANEPDVKDNITCSSGNSHRSLEHEKIRPIGETNCLTMKHKRNMERKKLRKRKEKGKKAEENVSGTSDMLAEIPNNFSQVAELDENIVKEFSSTCGKQSDIEKNLCSLEKEDVHGEAPALLNNFNNMSTFSKKKIVKKLKTDRRKEPSSRLTTGTGDFSEDLVHEVTSFHSDEAHISHLSDSKPEQVEERIRVTIAQASIGTSKTEASVHDPEQRLDLPQRPETTKLHSAEDGSAKVVLVESTAVTGATENKNAENPSSELLVFEGDINLDININKGSMPWQIPDISSKRTSVEPSRKKLLILDLNGLLADIIPYVGCGCKPDLIVSRKAVFKRPFVDDFLQFCFEKFAVGVWSSRTKRNVDPVVHFLMGDSKGKLLFCWDQSHCTITKFSTIENRDKPLVLKELRKLWDKLEPNLPWEKGLYNESNTLLLDDSPYKALRNPANTGIFPYSYHYRDAKDNSLGPEGDLRVYLESLALADDVRKYVEQNPFGQRAISKSNPSWNYYKRVLAADPPEDATSISK